MHLIHILPVSYSTSKQRICQIKKQQQSNQILIIVKIRREVMYHVIFGGHGRVYICLNVWAPESVRRRVIYTARMMCV